MFENPKENDDFLDLNFSYGFYIITVGRGHEFDLLIKYQVHRTISHRVMSSGSFEKWPSWIPDTQATLPFVVGKIQYFG